ncbi:MAG: rod shape-determining protein [Eubacteriales bacterium]|nr:rod shape-determining protein [Eubacteriales bacterium]
MKRTLVFNLSSSDITIYDLRKNKVIREKNYLAYQLDYDYSYIQLFDRRLLTFGDDAYEYFERNPKDVEVVRNIVNEKIVKPEEQALFLQKIMEKYDLLRGLSAPEGYLLISETTDGFNRYNYLKSLNLKSHRVIYIEDVLLSIPEIRASKGALIIYPGHESSFMMTVAGGDCIFLKKIDFNLEKLDETVCQYIKHHFKVMVSLKTTRRMRKELGLISVSGEEIVLPAVEIGSGLPIEIKLRDTLLQKIYEDSILQLITDIHSMLRRLPMEMNRSVLASPIYFCGQAVDDASLMDIIAKRFRTDYQLIDLDEVLLTADAKTIAEWSKKHA